MGSDDSPDQSDVLGALHKLIVVSGYLLTELVGRELDTLGDDTLGSGVDFLEMSLPRRMVVYNLMNTHNAEVIKGVQNGALPRTDINSLIMLPDIGVTEAKAELLAALYEQIVNINPDGVVDSEICLSQYQNRVTAAVVGVGMEVIGRYNTILAHCEAMDDLTEEEE